MTFLYPINRQSDDAKIKPLKKKVENLTDSVFFTIEIIATDKSGFLKTNLIIPNKLFVRPKNKVIID